MHEHHHFQPYKPRRKPKLTQADMLARVIFGTWALLQQQNRFVFTDEM